MARLYPALQTCSLVLVPIWAETGQGCLSGSCEVRKQEEDINRTMAERDKSDEALQLRVPHLFLDTSVFG